jgi:hypothetical protein
MTTKIPCLFFDGKGCGPTEHELWIERHDPKRPEEGDELFFGLRIANIGFVSGDRADAGGYMLQPATAAALHRELGLAIGTDPLVVERNELAAELLRCREELALMRPVAEAALARQRARKLRNAGLQDPGVGLEESSSRCWAAADAYERFDAAVDAYEAALAAKGAS